MPRTDRPFPAALTRRTLLTGAGAASLGLLAACGSGSSGSAASPAASPKASTPAKAASGPLNLSAIPDQDPAALGRLYPPVAKLLGDALGITVDYQPVTDYPAVVRAFEIGDISLSWMGGLTGVQARARVPGARAIVQRDIDADFHSLFIAGKASGLAPFTDVEGLKTLAGHTLTFGSETSTSGRLMPEYFIEQAGLKVSDLEGSPGFSGSHDATIEAVRAGSFEVGAVNEQVWKTTQEKGGVDLSGVQVLFRTPGYQDYHWLVRPDVDEKFGKGATRKITDALLALDVSKPADAQVLALFGAKRFIPAKNADYDKIEKVARSLDLLA